MLDVTGLHKRYGEVVAADAVDLRVTPGRITGFLGPNGAGKSTVMRSIFGLVEPDAGDIRLDDAPIDANGLRRIGYLPEQRGLYPKMPIGEQVEFFGRLKGMTATDARRVGQQILGELGLADRLTSPLDQLSHGNQQRVQLAVALVHEPDVLLLDEPFNGLDPVAVTVLADLLRTRAAAGSAVLFSSHQLDVVTDLVDDVTIIAAGSVRATGTIDDVRRNHGRPVLEVATIRPIDWTSLATAPAQVLDPASARFDVDADRVAAVLGEVDRAGGLDRISYEPPSLTTVFAEVTR